MDAQIESLLKNDDEFETEIVQSLDYQDRTISCIGKLDRFLTKSEISRSVSLLINNTEVSTPRNENTNLEAGRQYQTTILTHMWKKWKEQYLLNIRSAHKLKSPLPQKCLKGGAIVLVEGTKKSKFLWDLGAIVSVFGAAADLFVPATLKHQRTVQTASTIAVFLRTL